MNAKEALKHLTSWAEFGIDEGSDSIIKEHEKLEVTVGLLQQLIDQSNAKPKTLEEFGWGLTNNRTIFGREYQTYEKNEQVIFLGNDDKSVRVFDYRNGMCLPCDLSYEELLAIAEKMKELGMVND